MFQGRGPRLFTHPRRRASCVVRPLSPLPLHFEPRHKRHSYDPVHDGSARPFPSARPVAASPAVGHSPLAPGHSVAVVVRKLGIVEANCQIFPTHATNFAGPLRGWMA